MNCATGTCQVCGCTTGGGTFCFEHKPFTVCPLKDGSFYVDRYGRQRVSVEYLDSWPEGVTRFEVIDAGGRRLVAYDVRVTTSLQDEGRTLKVFLDPRSESAPSADAVDPSAGTQES